MTTITLDDLQGKQSLQTLQDVVSAPYVLGALYVIVADGTVILGQYREIYDGNGLPRFAVLAWVGDGLQPGETGAGICAGRRARVYSWNGRSARDFLSSAAVVREANMKTCRGLVLPHQEVAYDG